MKKILLWYHFKKNYTSSYSVLMQFKAFLMNREFFKKYGYEIVDGHDFIKDQDDKKKILDKNFELTDQEFKDIFIRAFDNFIDILANTDQYDNSILIGFHPFGSDQMFKCFNYQILRDKKCMLIMWQDDLHAYCGNLIHNQQKRGISLFDNNSSFFRDFRDYRMDLTDKIISPGIIYFKNINSNYLPKSFGIKFIFDESLFKVLPNNDYFQRKNKILLSGAINVKSNIRMDCYNLFHSQKEIKKLIDYLPQASKNRTKDLDKKGINYYKILSEYKAAFVGTYNFPINYSVAKIVEIMACQTLLIVNEHEDLKRYGLEKFKHYIPLLIDDTGHVIDDYAYYNNYLNNEEGKQIAKNGYEFVKKNLNTLTYCQEFLDIIAKN